MAEGPQKVQKYRFRCQESPEYFWEWFFNKDICFRDQLFLYNLNFESTMPKFCHVFTNFPSYPILPYLTDFDP